MVWTILDQVAWWHSRSIMAIEQKYSTERSMKAQEKQFTTSEQTCQLVGNIVEKDTDNKGYNHLPGEKIQ